MALLGFWGLGLGRLPDNCWTNAPGFSIVDESSNGLPAYAPWALYHSGVSDYFRFEIPPRATATDSIIIGAWVKVASAADYPYVSIQQSGVSEFVQLRLDSPNGEIQVTSSTSTEGSVSINHGTATVGVDGVDLSGWNFIEVEWYPHSSNGILRLRVNGATPTGWADVDTGDTSVADSATNLGFRLWQVKSFTNYVMTSGFYALDTSGPAPANALLGVCRFPFIPAAGDATSDFAGSDGNSVDNYALLDESPAAVASTSDNVVSSTPGDRQQCTVGPLSSTGLSGGTIVGVNSAVYATDSGEGRRVVHVGVDSNGSEVSSERTLKAVASSQFRTYVHTAPVDPDTDTTWTEAGFDAAEVFVEVA